MKISELLEAWVDHRIKATRRIPSGKIHPSGVKLRRMEREGTQRLTRALSQLRQRLFRGLTASTLPQALERLQDPDVVGPLRDAIQLSVQEWGLAGADFGREQVEANIFGVGKQDDPLVANWELVNEAAVTWAGNRAGELITGSILPSTSRRLQMEIANFAESGETMQSFLRRMEASDMFSPERARMIAITEVTRSYAEGNQLAWGGSGVVQSKEWNTANDELVCPICGPLDGHQVALDKAFPGSIDNPPAHPRCRCWITPVVEGDLQSGDDLFQDLDLARGDFPGFTDRVPQGLLQDAAQFTTADEIAFLESLGPDPMAAIRPPAGRAPSGLGTEYRQRRQIATTIEKHERWAAAADAKLMEYRGQSGFRAVWRINKAQERKLHLDRGLAAMMDIATTEGADWAFKHELIQGIQKSITAVTI